MDPDQEEVIDTITLGIFRDEKGLSAHLAGDLFHVNRSFFFMAELFVLLIKRVENGFKWAYDDGKEREYHE